MIGHVDADCFYVSCERVRDTRLMGKPVGVLGNQGACVIARSYEMRPAGVKVGMPIWKAKELCPDGIYIKRDFQWYEILSRQMQDILRQFSDKVEFYSVDESFVDFGHYQGDWKNLALTIQRRVLEEVGVPVSVGISLTRTLAKMASEKNKPMGIQTVTQQQIPSFLQNCSLGEIPGIGRKLIKRLSHFSNVLEYIQTPAPEIRHLLHKPGEQLWYELQGTVLFPIQEKRPERKVISRGGSIWGYYTDRGYIWGFLVRNLERLASQLVKEKIEISALTLLLMTAEGMTWKGKTQLPDYTNHFPLLLKALQEAFKQAFRPFYSYGYVHIIGAPLRSTRQKQLTLFEEKNAHQSKLLAIKEQINRKYGPFTLRSGATAAVPEVFADETSNFEICDIEGKICF